MRYLVHIDEPVVLLHDCKIADSARAVPADWLKTAEQTIAGERRNYYVACPPWRILVVTRNGLDLRRLNTGASKQVCYVDCLVGWDDGQSGFVREENKGRRHTKITISTLYTLSPEAAQANARAAGVEMIEWSALLAKAPRGDQRGGYRGTQGRHRLDADEPSIATTVRLPESLIALARSLGNGEVSDGLRTALRSINATPDAVTITSNKVIEHQVTPPTVNVAGRVCLDCGTGFLADILAAGVDAGVVPGEVVRVFDNIYYYSTDGYENMTAVVMLRPGGAA